MLCACGGGQVRGAAVEQPPLDVNGIKPFTSRQTEQKNEKLIQPPIHRRYQQCYDPSRPQSVHQPGSIPTPESRARNPNAELVPAMRLGSQLVRRVFYVVGTCRALSRSPFTDLFCLFKFFSFICSGCQQMLFLRLSGSVLMSYGPGVDSC